MTPKQINYRDHIVRIPGFVGGKPVIKGTRIPVDMILDRLTYDLDLSSLLQDYPRLTKDDIRAALAYAKYHIEAETTQEETTGDTKNQKAINETLALAGSWSDLDFDEMLKRLDHIRHESKPTPPFDLNL